LAHEVSALMGAADEAVWEWEGLFTSVDELCKLKGGGCDHYDHSIPSVASTQNTYLQFLSEENSTPFPGVRRELLKSHLNVGLGSVDTSRLIVGGGSIVLVHLAMGSKVEVKRVQTDPKSANNLWGSLHVKEVYHKRSVHV
jgi:hypothetical protein